jgi:hypothetical protein
MNAAQLILQANLSGAEVSVRDHDHEVIWQEGEQPHDEVLPPWSVRWYFVSAD